MVMGAWQKMDWIFKTVLNRTLKGFHKSRETAPTHVLGRKSVKNSYRQTAPHCSIALILY
jgi:hypothetical protein